MVNQLITVIVPVYNILEYLERCVLSICNQTYRNLQIILVDDGSTDGTSKLCDELAKKDNRIEVYHKENGGSSSARNLGLCHAKGKYVGFVDSDDYLRVDMYENLYRAIGEFHVSIAQIGRREEDEKGKQLPAICEIPSKDTVYAPEEFLEELLMHRGDCSFCTKLINIDLFTHKQFPLGVLNEDFNLLVQMLLGGEQIASVSKEGYVVCYRVGSNTRKESKEQFSRVYGDCVDNADMVLALVKERFPSMLPIAMRFGLFQRNEYLLHIPISQMTKQNVQYQEIVTYLKKNRIEIIKNPYLTKKNKIYLLMFSTNARFIRKVHKLWKQM